MAKLHKLTAVSVQKQTKPGRHSDGGGLYLYLGKEGRKSWVFVFVRAGKKTELGLGSVATVTLVEARKRAAAAREAVEAGRDPRRDRAGTVPTFSAMAETVIADLEKGWKNAKHRAQWRSTLSTYCRPIAALPVDQITTEHVLAILRPIWQTKAETASRVRGRIEHVLNAAKAKGYRTGENPAAWRGHLALLLPARSKLTRGHMAAMHYDDVPAFLERLRAVEGVGARCLEFAVLTAVRSGEARGARWDEITGDVWTIPAERMKAKRPHAVPLSREAMAVLDQMRPHGGEFVFPGIRNGRPLSDMTLTAVLRRMQLEVTVHGFRSSFRDWAGDKTRFPRELAEEALAHLVGNAVERSYRRMAALEKRRPLMDAWGRWCVPASENVIKLRG